MTESSKYDSNSPRILLKRIKANFPYIEWSTVKYIDEGWDHEVLILDDRLVFRFPNDQDYLELLHTEIEVLQRLKPFVSVRMPDYNYVASDYMFAGYPLIPGVALLPSAFDSLQPMDRANIARQLAAFLSTMHTLIRQGHDFSLVPGSYMPTDQADTKKLAEQHLHQVLDQTDFELAQAILAETDKLLSQHLPTVLLHGDMASQHLFWNDSDKRLGVIDFSDMNRGDPAFDFAELYEYGENFVQEVYSYYTGPKDPAFIGRAWTYQAWVGVYMMVDHFINRKTTFAVARKTFDRVKSQV